MANEFPQIQDSQPVLNPINVNSAASGYEEFGKVLGSIAGSAEAKTEEVVSEQSQTMYINSVANIEQLKTKAQEQMLEHPDQASRIAKDTAYTLDTIKNSAFVNSKDRTKLNSYISGANDDIGLKAVSTNVKQKQLEAAFTHYANWPDQLKAYQQALISDHDKADQLKTAMLTSLHGLVSIGALTPEQAGSGIKSMADVVGIANDHHELYGNPEATAKDYHTVASNPINPTSNNPNAPINGSTGWLIDYYNGDKSFQGVKADIVNRTLPNPMTFDSLQPAQRQEAIMMMRGVQVADGMINSGESFPVLEKTHQQLSEKGRVLNYRDAATRDALGTYINELKNGNYLDVIGKTPAGNSLLQNFVERNAAIQNTLTLSDDQKNQALIQNKNNMVSAAVSYGEAHHMPKEYVQPIPSADVANVENGFKLGSDPITVLQTVGQYSKQNQGYLAQAIKNPEHNMVVQGVSLSGNDIKPQDKLDFIASNQTGRASLNKDIEDSAKDKTLMTQIYANLAPQMRVIQQNYDPQRAQVMQNAMLSSTLKYAKFLAQKDNNIGATDKSGIIGTASWKKYVDQASRIYGIAFQQKSGTNWMVNPNQLPVPMSDHDLDVLADHVTNEGYKYLKEGRSFGEYQTAIDRNPLKMVITPTNDVQAVDGNGKVYYTMPFTSNTIPFAKESAIRREEDRKKSLAKAYEQSVKQQLNVRLPEDANPQ